MKILNRGGSDSIGSYFFSRFQVELRKYHSQEQAIFANGVQLQNREGQFAIVWMNSRADTIQVVVQGKFLCLISLIFKGSSPRQFWDEILKILNATLNGFHGINLSCSFLCPECILGVNGLLESLPDEIMKFSVYEKKEDSNKKTQDIKCDAGHMLKQSWVFEGFSPKFKFPSTENRVRDLSQVNGN